MTLPTPTGVSLTWQTREIPITFFDNPTFEHPDGVTLDMEEKSVTTAVGTYVGFYRDAKHPYPLSLLAERRQVAPTLRR